MEYIDEHKCMIIGKSIVITLMIVLFTIIFFLFVGISKVDAASYYFDYPRINTICNNNRLGICTEASGNGISSSDSKYVGNVNGNAIGNYVNVIYRYDQNINNISGTSYIPGNYSVSLKYQIRLVEGTELDKSKIKVRLIYYPDNSNQYAYATCDNNENITINNGFDDFDILNITYTCETLQITEGKSFLGFNINLNVNDPFGVAKYIKYGEVITNMTLIGEGEATNNDIINNQNQNQQQTNQGLQDIENAITDDSGPNLEAFNDYAGWLPPGPVDSILNLPLTILNSLTNLFSSTCTSANIPIPYLNKNIELPCVSTIYDKINGLNAVINTICIPVAAYILFKYFLHVYDFVDKTLTFRENNYIDNWGGV